MSYVICVQQRRRSACASAHSDQRLCCSLLRQYNISRFYSRNFKTLVSFSGCAGRFVSGLVGNYRRHVLSCRGSYTLFYSWLPQQVNPIIWFGEWDSKLVRSLTFLITICVFGRFQLEFREKITRASKNRA